MDRSRFSALGVPAALALLAGLAACAPDLGDETQAGVSTGYGGYGYAPDYVTPGYAAPFYDTPDPTGGVFLGERGEGWRHRGWNRDRDRGPGLGHGAPSQFPPGLSSRPAMPLRPPPAAAMPPPPIAPRPPDLAAIPRPAFAPPRPIAPPAPPPRIAPAPPRAPGAPWPPP